MTSAEIKKRREAKGLTQEDLAKLIGVSRVTVARWETDKTKPLPIFLQILKKKLKKS
jgi:transcriptional regulator with XRE-family HTH domain